MWSKIPINLWLSNHFCLSQACVLTESCFTIPPAGWTWTRAFASRCLFDYLLHLSQSLSVTTLAHFQQHCPACVHSAFHQRFAGSILSPLILEILYGNDEFLTKTLFSLIRTLLSDQISCSWDQQCIGSSTLLTAELYLLALHSWSRTHRPSSAIWESW